MLVGPGVRLGLCRTGVSAAPASPERDFLPDGQGSRQGGLRTVASTERPDAAAIRRAVGWSAATISPVLSPSAPGSAGRPATASTLTPSASTCADAYAHEVRHGRARQFDGNRAQLRWEPRRQVGPREPGAGKRLVSADRPGQAAPDDLRGSRYRARWAEIDRPGKDTHVRAGQLCACREVTRRDDDPAAAGGGSCRSPIAVTAASRTQPRASNRRGHPLRRAAISEIDTSASQARDGGAGGARKRSVDNQIACG